MSIRRTTLTLLTATTTLLGLLAWAHTSFSQTAPPATAPASQPAAALPITPRTAKTMIVLTGDSTTAPQNGWGPGFINCLTGDIQCVDLAVNGRSTKSFINEGRWKQTIDTKPDYIFIQFGHNDQKIEDPVRGTDPNTTFKENLTRFVTEARAIGAKPVLITPVSRRVWGDDGKTHSNLFDYANPTKEVAKALNVPLIDLHSLSIALYDKLGKDEVTTMGPDNTHFNAKGAKAIGTIIAEQVAKILPELASNIKPTPPATAPN